MPLKFLICLGGKNPLQGILEGDLHFLEAFHFEPPTDDDFQTFQEFVRLAREEGLSIEGALERIGQGRLGNRELIIEYLQRLEKKIESLEKENRALRDLVQKYERERLKGLPKPKETFLFR